MTCLGVDDHPIGKLLKEPARTHGLGQGQSLAVVPDTATSCKAAVRSVSQVTQRSCLLSATHCLSRATHVQVQRQAQKDMQAGTLDESSVDAYFQRHMQKVST